MKKTNAMRILEKENISYKVKAYDVDENNLDAVHVAKSANINIDLVYKTIVMINENKEIFVFCLPAEFDISLKKARFLTSSNKIELLKLDMLKKVTGYIRGGCSPLGMIKQYKTFISDFALLEDEIYVSAGVRGLQLIVNPKDLANCIGASFEEII
ncbi:MAG: Cys-tRNA(Pro) deacylase [Sphaerochaetaceae bacterium]|nr:Cys-tRNA(Pro) deacylase [Sphaerochaetaceae bacterium]MDC7237365.1 Cys-tRNA(Pro) deacylase [Sphaerochaetaceae bacterium]MDC7243338.1 Cys-tRNA(Pro) deacylase [Sphaerochaetaceae bacterium]MDC7251137.1 Cys-tRNA(Pro) deacylase [Sphaerochaetaceae bacterium]